MKSIFLVLTFLLTGTFIYGQQKILQIEKYGSPNTIQIREGDIIKIKLFDENKKWREVMVDQINPKNKTILFDIGIVHLDEIKAIRIQKNYQAARNVRNVLLYFGGGLLLLSPLNYVVGLPYNTTLGLYVAGAAIALGFIAEWFIKWVTTHKMGKRKWLRIIELPFDPPFATLHSSLQRNPLPVHNLQARNPGWSSLQMA